MFHVSLSWVVSSLCYGMGWIQGSQVCELKAQCASQETPCSLTCPLAPHPVSWEGNETGITAGIQTILSEWPVLCSVRMPLSMGLCAWVRETGKSQGNFTPRNVQQIQLHARA